METDKIYLGDAYDLIKQIPDKSVDLIVTDPPYELSSKGAGCFGNKERNYHAEYGSLSFKESQKQAKEESKQSYREDRSMIAIRKEISNISYGFDYSIMDDFVRVCRIPNIYVWCSRSQLSHILDFFEGMGLSTDVLEWHKTNPIPTCGSSYLHDTELCVFARANGVFFGGSFKTKYHFFVSKTNQADKADFEHPTIKPLPFIRNMIENSSERGGLILDPFAGSGTACEAAKELGRHYIGFEINPKWHKIAADRLNGITANGQTSLLDTDFGLLAGEAKKP
jgi:DNA modification methylase